MQEVLTQFYERLQGVDDKRAIFKNECQVAPGMFAS